MLLLIHSPLVGPLTWQPCAEVLQTRGHRVMVPSLLGVLPDQAQSYYLAHARRVADDVRNFAPRARPLLVAHSGAGSLLPSIADALDMAASGAMFVDGLLPHDGASFFEIAAAAVRDKLRGLVENGRLPSWDRWFPPGTLETLLPEATLRAHFVAELPELPVAYFEERAPESSRWQSVPCGYLRLSGPYDEAADEAERRGWPTVRLETDHLAMMTRPDMVATAIETLMRSLNV